MKDKYVIIDLRDMHIVKGEDGKIAYYDDEEYACNMCGMIEVEDAWVMKLVYNHKEDDIWGPHFEELEKRDRKRTTNGAYVIDSLGKMLLVHPTNHSENTWSIPKGMLNEGETSSKEAAIRETMEETGLDLTKFEDSTEYTDLDKVRYYRGGKMLHGHLFRIDKPLSTMDLDLKCTSYFHNTDTNNSEPECDSIKWEDISFGHKTLHKTQKKLLNKVKNILCL
jgi:8-oxo-dGTP pyrophosphatase MutT (NUDIX family)